MPPKATKCNTFIVDSSVVTMLGHRALGKQPAVAATVVGAQENVGGIVRHDKRRGHLPGIDKRPIGLAYRGADPAPVLETMGSRKLPSPCARASSAALPP